MGLEEESDRSEKDKDKVRQDSVESDTDLQNYVNLNDQAISLSVWDETNR